MRRALLVIAVALLSGCGNGLDFTGPGWVRVETDDGSVLMCRPPVIDTPYATLYTECYLIGRK